MKRFAYSTQNFYQAFIGTLHPKTFVINLLAALFLAVLVHSSFETNTNSSNDSVFLQGQNNTVNNLEISNAKQFFNEYASWHISFNFGQQLLVFLLLGLLFYSQSYTLKITRSRLSRFDKAHINSEFTTYFLQQSVLAFIGLTIFFFIIKFLLFIAIGILSFIAPPLDGFLALYYLIPTALLLLFLPSIVRTLGTTQDCLATLNPLYWLDIITNKIGDLSYGFILLISITICSIGWFLNMLLLDSNSLTFLSLLLGLAIIFYLWSFQSALLGTIEFSSTTAIKKVHNPKQDATHYEQKKPPNLAKKLALFEAGEYLPEADEVKQLVDGAFQKSDSDTILQLVSYYAKRYPNHRDVVANYFALSKTLFEHQKNHTKSLKLIHYLCKNFPEHPRYDELIKYGEIIKKSKPSELS